MRISIQTLNKKGKRENNEDTILSSSDHGLFMVCDGVGGNNKGEIASAIACESINQYFAAHDQNNYDQKDIDLAVVEAENNMDHHIAQHPDSKGMATTFTLLHLGPYTASIAHIGDSRIYHIRNGEIQFKTFDHNLVNELLASGNISPEQALNHPQRNVITRAIQGTEHSVLADFKQLDDLKVNDFFLLCSDGILEGIDDDFICENFTAHADPGLLITAIENRCEERSNDNFSAILIKLHELNEEMAIAVDSTTEPIASLSSETEPENWNEPSSKSNSATTIMLLLVFVLTGLGIYFFLARV